jgi:hypothetical protein
MKSCFAILLSAVVLGRLALPSAQGADQPAGGTDSILQQELKQQQIKATTKRVGDQLEAVIADFDRNGITGEDVKVLRAIRGVLDKLSESDMGKVLDYLQQSRAAADPTASARTATEAYAGQKAIVVQLQQLVLEYQRQQALYEISLRLKELASRQTANMWLGVSLAKSTEGKTSFSSFNENQKISLRYQQSEQNPLKDEVAAILSKLERLAQDIADSPTAERPKAALQQARDGGLTPSLQAAAEELKEDRLKLLSAIGNEKKSRDQMREIARLLILSQDPTDALKQALLELDRAIDAQKKVAAETDQTRKKDEADIRAIDQAIVVDDTDLIRRDIDSVAPIASEYLRNATDKMQEARASLSANDDAKKRIEKALPKQEEAITQMQAARRSLEEQLAQAEELKEHPENAVAALKELQEQVRELIQKQEAHKQETAATGRKQLPTKAPAQGELKDTAQELQAKAASPSPEAAQSIGEASGQMQKSQNSLAREQNNSPAQQAAIDALQRADQQLAQDIEKLEQAEKDLAQIEEMLKKLVAIIEGQQHVQLATTRQAVKAQPEPESLKESSGRQSQLSLETGALEQESAALVPAASSHLGDAKRHMDGAKLELDKPAPQVAQFRQGEALASLYLAKKEFENKINELRDQLGLPPAQDTDALAEAQKRIEEAQKQVNEALEQLQQAPPGLMEALQKQQQDIADALHELRQDAKDPKTFAEAQQAANQAAQQLGQSNLPKAIDSMKQARSAMQQARQESGQETQPNPAGRPGPNPPSLANLDKQQAAVQEAAEGLMAAQQQAPASAMQAAAEALQKANNAISPLAAGAMGQMPAGAQGALQSAQSSTAQGSAQAAAGQNPPAQQSASAAAQALAQAQAALSLAQAGVGSEAAMAQQGQGQGQGKGQGQGQGRGQAQGQGQGQGQGQPGPQGTGDRGNWAGAGGADGPRQGTTGNSSFLRLPGRDRAAIQQSQAEKYPQEYGPLVEQYLRNLSDQSGEK